MQKTGVVAVLKNGVVMVPIEKTIVMSGKDTKPEGARVFTKLDAVSGLWQVPLHHDSLLLLLEVGGGGW